MRRSLSTFLPDSACVFGNVLQVFRDAQEASEAIRLRATLQEKVACARSLPCVNCGLCHKHGRFCPFFQRAEVRVQGPPCPDFSAMGNRAGVHGQHMPAILAGGAKASAGKSAMVIVENVPGFPLHLAESAYDGYDFVESLQEPYMVGFEFMSRARTELRDVATHCKRSVLVSAFVGIPFQEVLRWLPQGQSRFDFRRQKLARSSSTPLAQGH